MNIAFTFFGKVFTEAIGWFLVHSVWQAGAAAIALFLVLKLLAKRSAQLRYYISYAALILVVFSSVVTFQRAFTYAHEKTQLKESLLSNPAYLISQLKENNISDEAAAPDSHLINLNINRIKFRSAIQKVFPLIVSLWVIGLLFYLVRVSGSVLYIFKIRSFERIPVKEQWISRTLRYCSRLKISKKVNIAQSLKIKNPTTIGFFKPLILIPVSLMTGITSEMIEAIIVHELAHIKRHDYLMNIIQNLVQTIFFFHPGVWYISAQISKERELACDDIALDLTSDRISYAKALAYAQENLLVENNLALAFASREKSLLQRIKRLNTKITMKTNLFEKLTAGVLILVAFISLSFIINGNNTEMKDWNNADRSTLDSTTESDVKIIHKEGPTSNNERKIAKRVYQSDDGEMDSLIAVLESHNVDEDEIEKVIEIVLTEPEIIDCEDIMKNIHVALMDVDMDEVSDEIREATKKIEILTQHALEECKELAEIEHLKCEDSLAYAIQYHYTSALDEAREEIEQLNIDSIVTAALAEAEVALEGIDLEIIIADALKDVEIALEDEHVKIIRIQKELEEKKAYHESEEELRQRESELKEQLEELEEQMRELKRKQKEVSRKNK